MIYVRNIQEGDRFILKRTGEIYTKLAVTVIYNKLRHNVLKKGSDTPTDLNHSCIVKPIYRYYDIYE